MQQQGIQSRDSHRRPWRRVMLFAGVPILAAFGMIHIVFGGRTVTYIDLNQATGEQRGRTFLYGIPFRTSVLETPSMEILTETPWPADALPEVWAPIRIHRHLGRARCMMVGGHWGQGALYLRDAERTMLHHGVPEDIRAETIELFIRGIPDGVYPMVYKDKATGALQADFLIDWSWEHDIQPIRIWPK